jgi:hypothetical protein
VVRKLTTLMLLAAGCWLIVVGARKWFDHREVAGVVSAFMDATRDGNRDALLTSLEPSKRIVAEARQKAAGVPEWKPIPDLKYRIHHINIAGGNAEAELLVERDGFHIRPVIQLRRSITSVWKVARIDKLEVDPRWLDLQEQQSRLAGQQIAADLAKALEGREGVSVDRAVLDDSTEGLSIEGLSD